MNLDVHANKESMIATFNLENAVKPVKIYFNDIKHSYTDEFSNPYTSVTTIKGKYVPHTDFKAVAVACERIGKNPRHKDYLKYKGKTAWQLLQEWERTTKEACDNGNEKHSFLELGVKDSNGYTSSKLVNKSINHEQVKLYTINEVIKDHSFGRIDLDTFAKTGIRERYPEIYATIEKATINGYYIYSELCVYDYERLVAGLIDLILINFTTGMFIIIDWKTNKADIKFESGYFEKDSQGKLTNNFISTYKVLLPPLASLSASTGNEYTIQLSTYAYLAELRGLTCKGIVLFQIREHHIKGELEKVTPLRIQYLKGQVEMMIDDHWKKTKSTNQYQVNMFI